MPPVATGTDPAARLLDGLNEEQRTAVRAAAAPLCVLAGAGSGKTRVLTRRIAYRSLTGDADPRRVLALTFTRKAAGELRDRVRGLGLRDDVTAGTFHAVAYAQLRSWWSAQGRTAPELLERRAQLVARLVPRGPRTQVADVVAEIDWARARLVDPASYPAAVDAAERRPPMAPEAVAAVYARYEEEKRRRRVVDYDDLLAHCRDALRSDAEFAAAQRWRHRHLFVDEFQDVNPLQLSLLRAWLGDSTDLCVVGDPNQAIYGWNGADPRFLRDFVRHFPGGTVLTLRRNHRSSPQILAVAAAALGHPRVSIAVRESGPLPEIVSYASDRAEAEGVARAIRDARGPHGRWSDQAVLVRTNAQVPLFEEALRAARIPSRTRAGSGLLDRPGVRAALSRLGRARDLRAALADLEAEAAALAPAADAVMPDEGEGPPPGGDGTDAPEAATRGAELDALARLGHDYLAVDPLGTGPGFAAWLRAVVARDPEHGDADAVDIATFHAAKGLEWPVVHVTGLERGLVPILHARSPEALAEEQRLLYVALTRAERRLRCSWAATRTMGTRVVKRRPSPLLPALHAAVGELSDGPPSARPVELVRAARAVLAADRDPDPLLVALRSWRAVAAQAAGVREGAVLSDEALDALVRLRPANPADLRAVPGLGPVKAGRFGPELLRVVAGAS